MFPALNELVTKPTAFCVVHQYFYQVWIQTTSTRYDLFHLNYSCFALFVHYAMICNMSKAILLCVMQRYPANVYWWKSIGGKIIFGSSNECMTCSVVVSLRRGYTTDNQAPTPQILGLVLLVITSDYTANQLILSLQMRMAHLQPLVKA